MGLEPELCRLCLVPVDAATVVILNQAVQLVESILQLTTIEVIIDSTRNVFMCDQCHNTLNMAQQFRKMCLQNDAAFKKMFSESMLKLDVEKEESDNFEAEFIDCEMEDQAQNNEIFEKLEVQDNKIIEQDQRPSSKKIRMKTRSKKCKNELEIDKKDQEEQQPVKVKTKTRKKYKTKNNPTMKIQCQVCGEFVSRYTLSRHMLVHTDDRPMFACDQCPKKYPYRKNLREHIEIVHEGKVWSCDKCGKSFNRKEGLNEHNIAVHTDLKKYECTVCHERFARSSYLNYHFKIKHTTLRPHACKYCEMTFKRSNDLIHHVRTHTGEKPFKCDLCDKRFSKSYNVVIHKKSHRNAELRKAAQLKTEVPS
ncbi:zinc finger protein 184-like isoform X4 [Armigeres subalbatus]